MNLRAKFVFSICLLGLLCVMLPGSVRADTVYTYTGNAYTSCAFGGTYCSGGPYALSITFDTTLMGAQLDNLATGVVVAGDLTAYISSFSFKDGSGKSITLANASGYGFDVSTDNTGAITGFNVSSYIIPPAGTAMSLLMFASPGNDGSVIGYNGVGGNTGFYSNGYNTNDPGVWKVVPEPSTILMLGSGLLCLVALAARSKRLTPSSSC
jgi:hypothetical protein